MISNHQESSCQKRPQRLLVIPTGPTYRPSVLPTIHPIESPSHRQSVQSYWDAKQLMCWVQRRLLCSWPLQRKPRKRWRGRRPHQLFCCGGQRPPPLYWLSIEKISSQSPQYLFSFSVRQDGLLVRRTLDWMDGRSDGRPIGRASRNAGQPVWTLPAGLLLPVVYFCPRYKFRNLFFPSACPPFRPSARPPVRLSARPPVRPSARPPVRSSALPLVRTSARPPVHSPAHPSVRLEKRCI